jgi:uncharacterized protein YjbI with pentapeptide repeats
MIFNVMNRNTVETQFSAEIECSEAEPRGVKLGLSVQWAAQNKANLRYADLSDADLRGANLTGAVGHGRGGKEVTA